MRKVKVKAAAGLNLPLHWHRHMKPFFNADAFQERINSRVGLNKDGKAIIRLVWAQDVTDRAFGQVIPRYWIRRRKVAEADGKYQYWTVPRWVLEKRMEPETYMAAWEQSRYSMQDEYGKPIDKGDAPLEYYVYANLIAEHEALDSSEWPACCTRAFYTDRSRCWGKYRQPADSDLQLISQAVRQMEADKYRDPYRPLTAVELAEIETMAGMQAERNAEQVLNQEREMAADFYSLPVSKIPENYGRRKSGLIVPNS